MDILQQNVYEANTLCLYEQKGDQIAKTKVKNKTKITNKQENKTFRKCSRLTYASMYQSEILMNYHFKDTQIDCRSLF